jgi:hypothetical protein
MMWTSQRRCRRSRRCTCSSLLHIPACNLTAYEERAALGSGGAQSAGGPRAASVRAAALQVAKGAFDRARTRTWLASSPLGSAWPAATLVARGPQRRACASPALSRVGRGSATPPSPACWVCSSAAGGCSPGYGWWLPRPALPPLRAAGSCAA